MLSLNSLEVRKSLQERLLEQAINVGLLTHAQYKALVNAFRIKGINIADFWNYVTDRKLEGHATKSDISSTIKSVLTLEEFNSLICSNITWAR